MRRTSLGGGSLCHSASGVPCFQKSQSCSHEGRNCADKEARVLGDLSKHRFLTMELRDVSGPKDPATGFNDDAVGVGWGRVGCFSVESPRLCGLYHC